MPIFEIFHTELSKFPRGGLDHTYTLYLQEHRGQTFAHARVFVRAELWALALSSYKDWGKVYVWAPS